MFDNNTSYPFQTQNNNGGDPAASRYNTVDQNDRNTEAPSPAVPPSQPPAAQPPASAGAPVGWQRLSVAPLPQGAPDTDSTPTSSSSTPNAGNTPISLSSTPMPHGSNPSTSIPAASGPYSAPAAPASAWSRPATTGAAPAYTANTPGAGTAPARPARQKKQGRGTGFVAAMLAASLLGGAAGGGATYLALSSGGAEGGAGTAIVEPVDSDPAAPASTNTNSPLTTSTVEGGEAYSITQVAETASPSVVEIACETQGTDFFFGNYSTGSSGSGVIVTADGFIVTNDHVVEGAQAIMVRTEDGEEYEATLIGTDSKTDLAVLKIDATGLTPATFADSDEVKVGETVVAIGNPLGSLGGTVTDGIISAKNREITIGEETMSLLQTSAAVNPGNSGGGLFNTRGELVGVVNAKSYGVEIEGLGFAIPSNTVAEVVEDMLEYGYVTGRPQLGISIVEINNPQAAMYYRVDEYGVYIAETVRDNGLRAGDRVLRINGREIEAAADITAFVESGKVGDVLEFDIVRDGEAVSVDVELVEKVPDYVQQAVETEKLSAAA